jgi:hypothetical protein
MRGRVLALYFDRLCVVGLHRTHQDLCHTAKCVHHCALKQGQLRPLTAQPICLTQD